MAAPLKQNEVALIVQSISLGDTRAETMAKFTKEFGRTINEITVSRVKARNLALIASTRQQIVNTGAITALRLKERSYKIIDRRLNRAEADESEIDKLRVQLQKGEITQAVFKEKVAVYEQLTLNELIKVADHAVVASKGQDDDPPSAADQAAFAMLVQGIKSGNPIQLIQVLNPTVNTQAAPAGNPAPSAA